jgi:Holliday junction resolvasome RuvABC endonuclease subunit
LRVLALDISTNVGWAIFNSRLSKPRLDTWRAPMAMVGHYGRRLSMFEEWLRGKVSLLQPELVAFESPIFVKWSSDLATNEHTIRLLGAMAGIAELVCWRASVRCIEVHSQTAKKCLAGNSRAKKDQMIAAAVKAGFDVANDHEADACAVALAAYNHVEGS